MDAQNTSQVNAAEWGMSGCTVPVSGLLPGDVLHLEPHIVHGHLVGRHITDVEVTALPRYISDDGHGDVIVDWSSCPQLLGAVPGRTGCAVFEAGQLVLVVGHHRQAVAS